MYKINICEITNYTVIYQLSTIYNNCMILILYLINNSILYTRVHTAQTLFYLFEIRLVCA